MVQLVIGDSTAEKIVKYAADPATVFHVQLAVNQASTDIIRYTYGEKEGLLKLVTELNSNELVITLINWGKAFRPHCHTTSGLER